MAGSSILIQTTDALGARRVSDGLRERGHAVETALPNQLCADTADILVLEYRENANLESVIRRANTRGSRVILVSASPDPTQLLARARPLGAAYVIAVSGSEQDALRGVTNLELASAIDAVLGHGDAALQRYVDAASIRRHSLSGLVDREGALDAVTEFLDAMSVGTGLAATLALVADELAANALRHGRGPVDFTFGSDGRLFAVAVRDESGTLTTEQLAAALDPSNPAGRGLLAAMHASNRLVFNLADGRHTEVIAVTDLESRAHMHPVARSVHVFLDSNDEARQPVSAAEPETIELSESMRIDVRGQLSAIATKQRRSAPVRPLRRRPKATPNPLNEVYRATIGVDTLRGLLRGATERDMALESAIRFLTGHTTATLLYRRDGEALVPHMAGGQVARWYSLGRLEPWLRAPSTPAIVARDQSLRAFAPRKRGLDRRIARTVGVSPSASSWAVPIVVAGDVDYVLCAFAPTIDRVVVIRMLLDVRSELEDALVRLSSPVQELYHRSGTQPPSTPSWQGRRAPTVPPYAEVELLYPRAITNDEYLSFSIDG